MEATLSSLAAGEQRQSRRRLVNFAAAISEEGASSTPAQVSDISEGGCRLHCDGEIGAGGDIWLKLPGLEARRVKIVWKDGRSVGCEFDQPLYAGEIETLSPIKQRADPKTIFRRA